MRFLILLLFSVSTFSAVSQADKKTFECSCTGQLQIVRDVRRGKIRYQQRQFQLNVWQNTFVANGNLVNETRTFNRGGFLSRGGRLRLVGLTADQGYMLYENSEFFLKVPRENGSPVYFRQKARINQAIQNDVAQWQILCTTTPKEP